MISGEIFTISLAEKGLISLTPKELLQIEKKTNNFIKLGKKYIHRVHKKRVANGILKRCSDLLIIKEMRIKTTLKLHLSSITLAKIYAYNTWILLANLQRNRHSCTLLIYPASIALVE